MAQFSRLARTDVMDGHAMMDREAIAEQSLRLLKAFVNIDDAGVREVIITIASFAESRARKGRARNSRTKAADGHVQMPEEF